jgi:hypothetical protein
VKKIFLIASLLFTFSLAQQGMDRIKQSWEKANKELDDSRFDAEKRIDDKFKNLEKRLNQLWDKVDKTGVKVFVDYGDDAKARKKVEFEKGFVQIEVIEDKSRENMMKEDMLKRINQELGDLAKSKDGNGVQFLKGQFEKEKTLKAVGSPERQEFTPADGIPKVKYTVTVPLRTDHLSERAKQYAPLAKKYADLYELPVDLILAVMECESTFNPYADNGLAYGLMQLVPKFGAYDAALTAFGEKQLIPPYKLKNPEVNAHLGCALLYQYLYWDAYLAKYKNIPYKHQLLGIAAYNAGIGNVLNFVNKNPSALSSSDDVFFSAFKNYLPAETKNYIVNVPAKRLEFQGL